MYCVIQEIETKKPNKYGAYKELMADSFTFTIGGVTKTKYTYNYSDERFERPIKKAFKISIHESKRVNGVVTKQQYVITTVDYYSLVEFWIGDCFLEKKLVSIAAKLETDIDNLWDLINAKVDPLQEKLKSEYEKTEEYKTHKRHTEIINRYSNAKSKFAKSYDCDQDEYDYCYNVFGELMNKSHLEKIVNAYKTKRSYQEQYHSNHNNDNRSRFNGGGYGSSPYINKSSYTDTEKIMLKKFYRTLSKEFHPDNIQGSGGEMQLVNRLKESWGI